MPSNHLTLCRPLSSCPQSFPASGSFPMSQLRWPKYWSFSFNISTSNEHPGLISFRMDWLDLLAVQGTLKSLLQHHSTKASILRHSAFSTVQLSHPYLTTGKTIALTRWTLVGRSFTIWATRKVQLSDLIIIASFRRKGKRAILWLSRHSYLWGALANVHANPQAHYGGRRPEQTQRILCLQILFYQL